MTNIATKNGSVIVKDGKLAESCGCCNEGCPCVNSLPSVIYANVTLTAVFYSYGDATNPGGGSATISLPFTRIPGFHSQCGAYAAAWGLIDNAYLIPWYVSSVSGNYITGPYGAPYSFGGDVRLLFTKKRHDIYVGQTPTTVSSIVVMFLRGMFSHFLQWQLPATQAAFITISESNLPWNYAGPVYSSSTTPCYSSLPSITVPIQTPHFYGVDPGTIQIQITGSAA